MENNFDITFFVCLSIGIISCNMKKMHPSALKVSLQDGDFFTGKGYTLRQKIGGN